VLGKFVTNPKAHLRMSKWEKKEGGGGGTYNEKFVATFGESGIEFGGQQRGGTRNPVKLCTGKGGEKPKYQSGKQVEANMYDRGGEGSGVVPICKKDFFTNEKKNRWGNGQKDLNFSNYARNTTGQKT